MSETANRTVLVTGATGYIGGRLVPKLLEAGYRVRCLARRPEKLSDRPWSDHPDLEIVAGDVLDQAELVEAMKGCDAAYYLVHSMIAAGREYAERDRALAVSFARASSGSELNRIVYLGGLGELGEDLSMHLRSRREVEEILGTSRVPLTTLRAAMIIGSGSASFETLRYLVERLPVMVTPRWVKTETQPIAVRNVLHYLVECLSVSETAGQTLDIGCEDVMTYQQLMQIMAEELGLRKRLIVPVPVLTPRLSSLWIGLVTPVSSQIARPLAEGLRNRTVCRNMRASELMPQRLLSAHEAISAALQNLGSAGIETNWSMAGEMPGDPEWSGGTVFLDERECVIDAPADQVFRTVCRIGGESGYWGGDFLWRLRGLMDQMVGGPGLRRGRRHPEDLHYGEAIDFWRVTGLEQGERLLLRAEMKLPGVAELEFRLEPIDSQQTRLIQTARFRPLGLFGIAYWYAVVPLHHFVFQYLLNGIRREAE
ncbi:3 beta-hydroxysteroid dehydrogenase/Delta 5--_4-isomerase [Maioricimonas rarisocia]|uniref:3 beta-hydroxysteroid dehydrogenase/Delta 5-->4-isomerase n=1 Tax=Maioricimonas rarisocia TaxID=2528026 RepID=A0A517Z2I4_9PLAN|nr:SDR family oxidoreductase [Maioricimonas rarisocia]QDU36682.1 3 beta-hydroxysteroid dehydrogenase/Delta 5-->4-isomerase [Maioricimonas rarisocia]